MFDHFNDIFNNLMIIIMIYICVGYKPITKDVATIFSSLYVVSYFVNGRILLTLQTLLGIFCFH